MSEMNYKEYKRLIVQSLIDSELEYPWVPKGMSIEKAHEYHERFIESLSKWSKGKRYW